jgi:hypothetical protein
MEAQAALTPMLSELGLDAKANTPKPLSASAAVTGSKRMICAGNDLG